MLDVVVNGGQNEEAIFASHALALVVVSYALAENFASLQVHLNKHADSTPRGRRAIVSGMATPAFDLAEGLALHLLPAVGRAEDLAASIDALPTVARRWRHRMAGIVNAGPHTCVLEYRQPPAEALDSAERDLAWLGDRVDLGGSFALAGEQLIFIASAEIPPIRYWYCMLRRDDFSHDDYLVRYRDIHSQFGIDTSGIEGYIQWHANLEASAAACERLGVGGCPYDSISVLDIADLNAFFTAAMSTDIGERATADEQLFVNRANSHDHILELAHPRTGGH